MAGLLKVRNYTNSVFYTSSVNTTNMDYNRRNVDFQLGLLHFVHLLVTVDGKIDDREREAIHSIKGEEEIPGSVFHHTL
jgi:hypothetical protein